MTPMSCNIPIDVHSDNASVEIVRIFVRLVRVLHIPDVFGLTQNTQVLDVIHNGAAVYRWMVTWHLSQLP